MTTAPSLADQNAQALWTASGGKATWSQLATLVAIADVQSSGGQDIEQYGDTPAQLGQPLVGFGPWQVTPWTSADGVPNLQNAANAAWTKFQTQGYGAWELNDTGTALGSDDQNLNPNGYVPTAAQFQQGAAAATKVMGTKPNLQAPGNQAVVGAMTAAGANAAAVDAAGGSTCPTCAVQPKNSFFYDCGTAGTKGLINFQLVKGTANINYATQCQMKALAGAGMMASGIVLMLIGVVMAFDRSGKLSGAVRNKAGIAAAAVPGGAMVGAAMQRTGSHAQSAALRSAGQQKQNAAQGRKQKARASLQSQNIQAKQNAATLRQTSKMTAPSRGTKKAATNVRQQAQKPMKPSPSMGAGFAAGARPPAGSVGGASFGQKIASGAKAVPEVAG